MSDSFAPGGLEVAGQFRKHVGPRFMAAGLRLQFHRNQGQGVHFKTVVSEEYRGAILKGINDGMSIHFPEFLKTGTVWITEITEDPVDSSRWAFYAAARSAIELAYTIVQLKDVQL